MKTQREIGAQDRAVEAAQDYARRGRNPTPVIAGQKAVRLPEWPTLRMSADDVPEFFEAGDMVGLVLGESSGGLVCVDLDSDVAVWLGSGSFLPETGLIATRPGKPDSHRFYVCDPLPPPSSYKSAKTGKPHVEIKATGTQVVVPPSLHPSGETWMWKADAEPARLTAAELVLRVEQFAAVAELITIWPTGSRTGIRHEATMHLSGGLLRAGWTEADVLWLAGVLVDWSGDTEREDRMRVVRATVERHTAGQATTGWPKLAELLDAKPSVSRILSWLGVDGDDLDDPRPVVALRAGNLEKLTDETWEAIAQANEPPVLFRRSNRIVRIEADGDRSSRMIADITEASLRHHLVEMVRWIKPFETGSKTKRVSTVPPLELLRNLMAEPDIPLPVLSRVVQVPVYSPTGTLQTEAGYHADAELFLSPMDGLTIPDVSDKPTQASVDAARTLLLEGLLGDFPFESDAERAAAVALGLLPFVRDMIDGPTPIHLFEAAAQGTGKGLLVRVLTMLSSENGAMETAYKSNEEEMAKTVFAALRQGPAHLLIDNIDTEWRSAEVAVALTTGEYRGRVLGVSETTTVRTRCVWIATANNARLSDDLLRRSIRCRMNARVEEPYRRTGFKHIDLAGWVRNNRSALVGAALTLIQAWLEAGQPGGRHTLGSFERWASVMGGILAVAGVPGFLENTDDFYEAARGEGGTSWRSFVEEWWRRFGTDWVSAGDLIPVATQVELPFKQREETKQRTELGAEIAKRRGQTVSGLEIQQLLGSDGKAGRIRNKGNGYRLLARDGRVWTPPDPSSVLPEQFAVDLSAMQAATNNPFE